MLQAVLKSTPQTLHELSDEEFKIISSVKIPRESFENLQYKIHKLIPRLRPFSPEQIKEMYYNKEMKMYFFDNSATEEYLTSEDGINELVEFANNVPHYLMKKPYPFSIRRKDKEWSDIEISTFIKLYEESQIVDFTAFTLCLPGRNRSQIYGLYHRLLSEEVIIEKPSNQDSEMSEMPFDVHMHRYFLAPTEAVIANEITDLFMSGMQITENIIREKAKFHFYRPHVLAERALYREYRIERKDIYAQDGKDYTQEFIQEAQEWTAKVSELILDENGEVNFDIADHFIKEQRLPKGRFSSQWIRSFMKRNRLSWRHGHYARRGNIDQEYARKYMLKLAIAITKYSYDFVFNVDETAVRIINSTTRTVAPIGMDQIIINAEVRDKECITAIGTCTRENTYPFIIVTKGTTERSCSKFKIRGDTQVWFSGTQKSWVNEDIMIQYLDYLFEHWSMKQPCALVLDCFKAHCTKAVRRFAKEHFIELIFVPANGTSDFQPLDRRVFGILKSKLRSLAGSRIFSGKQRFEMIARDLVNAWSEISKENLISAWNIPNLENLVERIARGEPIEEEDVELEFDTNEEEEEWYSDDEDLDYRDF